VAAGSDENRERKLSMVVVEKVKEQLAASIEALLNKLGMEPPPALMNLATEASKMSIGADEAAVEPMDAAADTAKADAPLETAQQVAAA